MLNRLLHPTTRALSDFVDGELTPDHARRVARHVAACERCRDFVWSCRRLDAAAQELYADEQSAPLPGASLRERVLARRAAGDDVILPVPGETSRDHSILFRVSRYAAAAVVLVAVGLAVYMAKPSSLTAEWSELTMTPATPREGDTVRVTYRATSRLSGHDELVLRARHARPNVIMNATDRTVLTRLTRQRDGTYVGKFVLPRDVPFAVLAVEDPDARDIDHNGERWEVLLHDVNGIPLHEALDQQFSDTRMRDRILAAERAARMAELYPNSVRARTNQYSATADLLDRDRIDSVRAAHRARLPELLAAQPASMTPDQLTSIVFYAGMVEDTAAARLHRERLIADYPLSPGAQQQRVFMVGRTWAGDTAAYWNGLERIWQDTEGQPRHAQIAFSGWQAAQQWRDTGALALWGRRLAEQDGSTGWVGQAFAATPELRDEGIAMVQEYLATRSADADWPRALTQTADEARTTRLRYRGRLLADLGRALSAVGRDAESQAAFSEAVGLAWDPQLFRTVAAARLQAGDTLGALPLLARVAVDPSTAPAYVDSVRTRTGPHFDEQSWTSWRDDALETMRHHTMFLATNRPVRGTPRLQSSDGVLQPLNVADGRLTFVAFWSRYCPPSHMQLAQVAQLARTLEQRGVRVLTITEERPSAQLAAFLAQNNLDFNVLHDVDHEARRAFDNFGTPAYMVVDGRGRVRFQSHGLDDVLRQVVLLE